ncbi:MAG: polyprenyl diphosphate synthase [Spirochaetia bacterium]|nr:polyprenyl diphosphate synthase [Spirochaetia bacterium]
MITLKVPEHIGIIMDGNGRWAQNQGKPRTFGHTAGLEAAKRIAKAASDMGVKYLSLYTFSTENWKRSETEVTFLMGLLKYHLRNEYRFYQENGIRVVHSGSLQQLPSAVQKELTDVQAITAGFTGLTVNLAINYGGRDEIIRAIRKIRGSGPGEITEELLSANMDHPEIPDPDLIIRTAGEMRLSNFLLWESAYSEFYFSSKYWPEWDKDDLVAAIESYQGRTRKYGAITE